MRFLPHNVASFGGDLDTLIAVITVLTGAGLLLAEGVLLYALVRFRRPVHPQARYLTGEGWAQARWVLAPVALLLGADLYIDYRTHATWEAVKGSVPEADQEVRITGRQFNWMITYPGPDGRLGTADDFERPGELRVPLNETVVFDLEARDVLHSFWVPALRLKQDAVPGRTIRGWFRATELGTYDVACAEICGAGHTLMKSTLRVVPPEDYRAWLARGGREGEPDSTASSLTPIEREGQALVQARGCLACHSTDGSPSIGPTYLGLYGRTEKVLTGGKERDQLVDDQYLRRSILDPAADVVQGYQPLMPSQAGLLSDAELARIIAYLKTIR